MREKKAVGAVWISMNNDGDEKIQFMIRCTLVKEKSEQKIQAKSAIVCLKMTVKHFTWWVFSLSPPFLSPLHSLSFSLHHWSFSPSIIRSTPHGSHQMLNIQFKSIMSVPNEWMNRLPLHIASVTIMLCILGIYFTVIHTHARAGCKSGSQRKWRITSQPKHL